VLRSFIHFQEIVVAPVGRKSMLHDDEKQ